MQGSLAFGAGSCVPALQFGGSDQVQAHPQTQNWTLGLVQPQCRILDQTWVQFTEGSGPDQSSEPNCSIPKLESNSKRLIAWHLSTMMTLNSLSAL